MIVDPGETQDIYSKYPEIVKKMRAAYQEWFYDVTRGLKNPVYISLGAPQENPTTLTA